MGKGEIACYEQFLLFPQCFQKACFRGASKDVVLWEWVKDLLTFSTYSSPKLADCDCIMGSFSSEFNLTRISRFPVDLHTVTLTVNRRPTRNEQWQQSLNKVQQNAFMTSKIIVEYVCLQIQLDTFKCIFHKSSSPRLVFPNGRSRLDIQHLIFYHNSFSLSEAWKST